jgi:hypothetical protein
MRATQVIKTKGSEVCSEPFFFTELYARLGGPHPPTLRFGAASENCRARRSFSEGGFAGHDS